MPVLATIFKQNMQDKEGYVSVQEMLEDGFSSHIFNGCLKVHPKPHQEHFSQWLVYWQGFPFAIECTVSSVLMSNNLVKVTILGKKMHQIMEIGEYTSSRNTAFGSIINGKFILEKDLPEHLKGIAEQSLSAEPVKTRITKKQIEEKVTQEKMEEFKKTIESNWGCKFK